MAIKSFVNPDPAGLSFKIGDIVFVPKANEGDATWQGVSNSVVGTFPSANVLDTAGKAKDELSEMVEKLKLEPEEESAGAAYDAWKEVRDGNPTFWCCLALLLLSR
jgi:hypothetical protein